MKKTIISLVASILLSLAFVYAQQYTCPMGGMMTGSYGPGISILSWLTWLLGIVLVLAAIYWLIKSANRKK